MGTDIHLYVEVRRDGAWHLQPMPRSAPLDFTHDGYEGWSGRNYAVFSILCGVRGALEPLVAPRGLPEDLSRELVAAQEGGSDGVWLGEHSFSWWGYEDILALAESKKTCWASDGYVYTYAEIAQNFLAWAARDVRPLVEKYGADNVRIVFGFDS